MNASSLCVRVLMVSVALCPVALARAAERVVIQGGADGTGQNYEWLVRNAHTSPIVWISFPHFHADTFKAPDGWTITCTNLARAETEDARIPGTCEASAPSPGLAPGTAAKFEMRIARAGADPRRGAVTVRFADGLEEVVRGVELPTAKSAIERAITPIGLGALFVILVARAYWRRRKGPAPA